MIENEHMVFLAPRDFDDLRARVHHLSRAFAASNRVLFVETQESLAFLLRRGKWSKLRRGFLSPVRQIEGLWVFTPLACLPFDGASELVNRVNTALLRWQLRRVLKKLGFHKPILFVYMPSYHRLIGELGERCVIYDLVDERAALPGRHHRYFERRELATMRKCGLTVVVSERLFEAKKERAHRIALIPNGVDADMFAAEHEPASEVSGLPRPVIGYVGAVDVWLDFDLVAHMARSRPSWSFVFVGPIRTRSTALGRLANVHLLGERAYEELPSYIVAFDCCIVPHKLTRFRLYSDPLKVYEYIAAGKPVVSVPIPSVVERFGALVRIAADATDFVSSIEEEIESDSQEKVSRRREAARRFDWRLRAEAMSAEIRRILDDNDG